MDIIVINKNRKNKYLESLIKGVKLFIQKDNII